jgi:hypothetical protein
MHNAANLGSTEAKAKAKAEAKAKAKAKAKTKADWGERWEPNLWTKHICNFCVINILKYM